MRKNSESQSVTGTCPLSPPKEVCINLYVVAFFKSLGTYLFLHLRAMNGRTFTRHLDMGKAIDGTRQLLTSAMRHQNGYISLHFDSDSVPPYERCSKYAVFLRHPKSPFKKSKTPCLWVL